MNERAFSEKKCDFDLSNSIMYSTMISTGSVRFFGLLSVGWVIGMWLVRPERAPAQPAPTLGVAIPLNDLSSFVSPGSNWYIVGSIRADLNKVNTLTTEKGTGALANVLTGATSGQKANLLTNLQHGDADLELDYTIATGPNSGMFLQERYKVQLFDSRSVQRPTTTDNGAIYERWDEKRPDGQKGCEGHPPRQNVSRVPGLW